MDKRVGGNEETATRISNSTANYQLPFSLHCDLRPVRVGDNVYDTQTMRPSYAVLCTVLSGIAHVILWTGNFAATFISESVLHSVNGREPERIGAHDGYYGLAVSNVFYMLSTLVVPSFSNYFRSKWILALSGACFTFYYLSFQYLNRYLYFFASAVVGMAMASFNIGDSGYLTEISTRETIERNQALSWGVSCFSVFGAGTVNLMVTMMNLNENGTVSKYGYAAIALLGTVAMFLYSILPNRELKDCIAASNIRRKTLKEQLSVMIAVLFHKRVLILVPFYLYVGFFFSFWTSIIPTTLHFTKALSLNVYMLAWFGMMFTVGSVMMSMITIKMSTIVRNFSFKPLLVINALVHLSLYALCVCVIPKWSTVRPNEEPSLLIQPSVLPVLAIAFLCGLGNASNITMRTVISSLLLPTRRQQTFGASRFYHGLAASVIFFASPSLSIYSYAAILSAFLVVASIVYLCTCNYVSREERKVADQVAPANVENTLRKEKNTECVN